MSKPTHGDVNHGQIADIKFAFVADGFESKDEALNWLRELD